MNERLGTKELAVILAAHGKWLRGEADGVRADLREAQFVALAQRDIRSRSNPAPRH